MMSVLLIDELKICLIEKKEKKRKSIDITMSFDSVRTPQPPHPNK